MNLMLVVFAALSGTGVPCSAKAELARAAAAVRSARAMIDTEQIEVQVPGAPRHDESVEYGFTRDRMSMRMPALYAIELRGDRFLITEDGRRDAYVSAPAGEDLQASLDAAFGGAGSPVIPPPLLLSRARTADEQAQAFRLKVFGRLGRGTCSGGEVTLAADNGTVRFRVGEDGWIREIDGEIATGPDQPSIVATVRFTPRPGVSPPPFVAASARLSSVKELTAVPEAAVLPDIELRDLDGGAVRLRDPNRTTVLEFWATWCAPCRLTLPKIARFARSHKDVRVLLVNLQENGERIRPYLAAAGIDLPAVVDADGSLLKLGGGLPLTVVVSRDGRVLKRQAGFDDAIASWLAGVR